jgi:glycosyltransferase involved in cell wall biosynthesis
MSDRSDLRVAVLQPGARLHYAVPALLERAGMLQRLYTDCANTGLLRRLGSLWPSQMQPTSVRRLLGRRLPPEIPTAKVRQVRAAVAHDLLNTIFPTKKRREPSRALMDLALKERFGGANTIYTVLVNEDLEFCRKAKEQGCRIVHEAMLSPDIGLVAHDEYCRYGNRATAPTLDEINSGRERDRQKYAIADLILAPSNMVREAILALGADGSSVVVVPYGLDRSWLDYPVEPVRGRVLFVGRTGLLKGTHYLADAARQLARRRVDCEVRVVGQITIDVANEPIFAGPKYIGPVPRAEIHCEYAAADIFVLPSLSESFGLVTLEAMAMGLPVIATPPAGSCVRHEIDGLIVPPRDAQALASAIERLVTDRALRQTMSRNAKERAAEFTWEKYESRLIAALATLSPAPGAF